MGNIVRGFKGKSFNTTGGNKVSLEIAGVSFVPDFVAETERVIKRSGIPFDSQLTKTFKVFNTVPLVGDIAGILLSIPETYNSGGREPVDYLAGASWNALTLGVGFIPYVGPVLSFGLEVGNYLSGGQWEAGFEGAVEDGIRSLGN